MLPARPRTLIGALVAVLLVQVAAPARSASQEAAPAAVPDSIAITPRGALVRSFAVPGWGQVYAGAPGRGAIYFAMEATSLWMAFKSSRGLSASRAGDRFLREQGRLDEQQISGRTRARAQQFEDWVTLAAFVLLFSGADAYVTAQLADFADNVTVRGGDGTLRIEAGIPLPGGR